MTPIAAYNVDILHHRSAEAYAVTRYEVLSRVQMPILSPVITTTAHFETASLHSQQRLIYPSSTVSGCWQRMQLLLRLRG